VNAGQRQRFRAAIDRTGDRLGELEQRFARLERALFANAEPDHLAERVARRFSRR